MLKEVKSNDDYFCNHALRYISNVMIVKTNLKMNNISRASTMMYSRGWYVHLEWFEFKICSSQVITSTIRNFL